ncbi:unnamed protein product [Calypogeia fissa]
MAMDVQAKSKIQNIAEVGSSVLLDINDGDRMTFARLHANSTLKIANVKCSLEALIGSPFGAIFEMQKSKLVRINPSESDVKSSDNGKEVDEKDESGQIEDARERDNRNLIDTNTSQTLSSGDIEKMRKDGASGKQIIDALVANSSSFDQKTPFSQEKYMRKKQKKYAPRVILRRPSARSICEAYFAKDPRKIGFCRMDTLALMLSLSNVGANSDVLVLDSLGGLITAAVAERVGGHGVICSTYYTAKRPTIDMVRLLNIDDATAKSVLRSPIATLIEGRRRFSGGSLKESDKSDSIEDGKEANTLGDTRENSTTVDIPTTEAAECLEKDAIRTNGAEVATSDTFELRSMDIDHDSLNTIKPEEQLLDMEQSENVESNSSFNEEKVKGPRPGLEAGTTEIDRWGSQGFTSLLVAAPELDPWTVAEQLLPLLSSSSPFVIYHSYQQPLAECMHKLQANNLAVALQLSEPWSREYQVLPSRTHPHMQMSATGGYTLSGIYIVN